jgi:hypothetical protein
MKRHCSKCKTKKPLDDFYRDKGGPLGRSYVCKVCTKDRVRQWNLDNPNKTKIRSRIWRMENRPDWVETRKQAIRKEGASKFKKRVKIASQKTYQKNKVRHHCRAITAHAIHIGNVKKEPCSICGKQEVVAHHCDYSQPLNVTWLCQKHHVAWHRVFIPESP